jgi:hypothetical protein
MKDVPEVLNKITDVVLAYRPKPKTKAARKRSKQAKAIKRTMKRAAD